VNDEGPGIPPELRGQVFEKFFRAGLQPGLGMGLAITRGIVQAHGGKIWIEDGPERRGTSVQFMVPLSNAPAIQTSNNEVPQNDVAQRDVPRNNDAATPDSPPAVTSGEHS
jgi:K+-sensing histidine kinase KdpD